MASPLLRGLEFTTTKSFLQGQFSKIEIVNSRMVPGQGCGEGGPGLNCYLTSSTYSAGPLLCFVGIGGGGGGQHIYGVTMFL